MTHRSINKEIILKVTHRSVNKEIILKLFIAYLKMKSSAKLKKKFNTSKRNQQQ